MNTWQWRRRGDTPRCTGMMHDVLSQLVAAGGSCVVTVHPNTMHALRRADMVIVTHDGLCHITALGREVQRVYAIPKANYGPRKDDICPDCGVRRRHRYSSGRTAGYCKPCRNKRASVYSRRCREYRFRRYAQKLLGGKP